MSQSERSSCEVSPSQFFFVDMSKTKVRSSSRMRQNRANWRPNSNTPWAESPPLMSWRFWRRLSNRDPSSRWPQRQSRQAWSNLPLIFWTEAVSRYKENLLFRNTLFNCMSAFKKTKKNTHFFSIPDIEFGRCQCRGSGISETGRRRPHPLHGGPHLSFPEGYRLPLRAGTESGSQDRKFEGI